MRQKLKYLIWMFVAVLAFLAPQTTLAQWSYQTFNLKPGWNAVYLNVDISYTTLDELFGADSSNPIQEIWMWTPTSSALQFIDGPQQPLDSGTQWATYNRDLSTVNSLNRMVANAAYLVKVSTTVNSFAWKLKGKPVPPHYQWTTTGLNFIGFSTPTNSVPTFDSFFAAVPDFRRAAEIYYYNGGDLGQNNPARLFALRTQTVNRGQAYWLRAGGLFNRYFGPFELDLPSASGVEFHDTLSTARILIRNIHPTNIVVSLQMLASESAPVGQPSVSGVPPVLLRGALNTTNLVYGFTNLNSTLQQWTLKPAGQIGSEVELILGINRSAMSGTPGDVFAGVLRFTDSFNLSQVNVPLSAEIGSTAGLWIGNADVSQVQHYLKQFEKDANGKPVVSGGFQYSATNLDTSLGKVARNFPLRLIIHNDEQNNSKLLQRVFYGMDTHTNLVNSTTETVLNPSQLTTARRISAVHLPFSANNVFWNFSGALQQGGALTTRVDVAYNNTAANPFIHTYHPDHDNLDTTFKNALPQGSESYGISRDIILTITPPANDFSSLTSGNQSLSGVYDETVTLNGKPGDTRKYNVRGTFSLNRVNRISTLTHP